MKISEITNQHKFLKPRLSHDKTEVWLLPKQYICCFWNWLLEITIKTQFQNLNRSSLTEENTNKGLNFYLNIKEFKVPTNCVYYFVVKHTPSTRQVESKVFFCTGCFRQNITLASLSKTRRSRSVYLCQLVDKMRKLLILLSSDCNEPRFVIISEDFMDNLICTSLFWPISRFILKQLDLSASWITSLNSPFGLRPHGLLTRSTSSGWRPRHK